MEIDEFVSFDDDDHVEAPSACSAICAWQVSMDEDMLDSFVEEPHVAHSAACSARVDPNVEMVPPEVLQARLLFTNAS